MFPTLIRSISQSDSGTVSVLTKTDMSGQFGNPVLDR